MHARSMRSQSPRSTSRLERNRSSSTEPLDVERIPPQDESRSFDVYYYISQVDHAASRRSRLWWPTPSTIWGRHAPCIALDRDDRTDGGDRCLRTGPQLPPLAGARQWYTRKATELGDPVHHI